LNWNAIVSASLSPVRCAGVWCALAPAAGGKKITIFSRENPACLQDLQACLAQGRRSKRRINLTRLNASRRGPGGKIGECGHGESERAAVAK
jgi:hypothetical protein